MYTVSTVDCSQLTSQSNCLHLLLPTARDLSRHVTALTGFNDTLSELHRQRDRSIRQQLLILHTLHKHFIDAIENILC